MRVILADVREAELERMGDAGARDKPHRALSFVLEIRESCEVLGETPEAFPLVPQHQGSGVRRRVHGDYLIFYRIARDVVGVLHGAMNYEELLFGERGTR